MRKLPEKQELMLDGPAGVLEAILESPRDVDPLGCAVVCHPHPVHGGTMTNKVAHTLARAFLSVGFIALRFNFRGVGKSAGTFDDGIGELEDVHAAVRFMREQHPDLPLWLAGFSFGAAMAVHAASTSSPAGLVSIAPAVSRFVGRLDRQPDCPWLILQGDEDELVDIDETVKWVDQLAPGPELEIFPGAEHFFHGRLVELRESVAAFVSANS